MIDNIYINELGIEFKMWVYRNYNTLWHQLDSDTLESAIDTWNTFR